MIRKSRERDEKGQRAPQNPDNIPNQVDQEKAQEIDNLPTESVLETAKANLELVRVMLERERETSTAEKCKAEAKGYDNLRKDGGTEQRRRRMLIDELKVKYAQLYDAQKKITELTKRLLTI